MSVTSRGIDPACFDLADHFLSESPEAWRGMHRQELAGAIQQAVEDYFLVNEDLLNPPEDQP